MITKRDQWMHNSWFANLERMKRSGRDLNPLGINPADAAARQLADGDEAVLHNEWGEIEVVVRHDDDLLPGVVSLVHGWGHAKVPGMTVAQRMPGVNPNALLPVGAGQLRAAVQPGAHDRHPGGAQPPGLTVGVQRVTPPLR